MSKQDGQLNWLNNEQEKLLGGMQKKQKGVSNEIGGNLNNKQSRKISIFKKKLDKFLGALHTDRFLRQTSVNRTENE